MFDRAQNMPLTDVLVRYHYEISIRFNQQVNIMLISIPASHSLEGEVVISFTNLHVVTH